MRMVDLIEKKRDGMVLSREEITFIIENYTNGLIPDYQMSALTMAIFFQGMNDEEATNNCESAVDIAAATIAASKKPAIIGGKIC